MDDEETSAVLQAVKDAAKRVADAEMAVVNSKDEERKIVASNLAEFASEADQVAKSRLSAAAAALASAQKAEAEAAADLERAREKSGEKWADGNVDDAVERLESAKAGALAGLTGAFVSTPLVLSMGLGVWPALFSQFYTGATCLLFGVCYRYAMRRDQGNKHLKSGTVAAFVVSRALGQVDLIQSIAAGGGSQGDLLSRGLFSIATGALAIGFAAVALDWAFTKELVLPFPSTGDKGKK
eukprot:jgi/Mesvir1/17900/Mv12968-RA.1